MSALSGAQTAGSQYAETYGQLREEGKTHAQAWLATAPFALASGLANEPTRQPIARDVPAYLNNEVRTAAR